MSPEKQPKDKRMGSLWEPVEASPEEIAKACMEGPPKEKWDYIEKPKKRAKGGRSL